MTTTTQTQTQSQTITLSPAGKRALRSVQPATPDELHGYCRLVLGFNMPRTPMELGMSSPFDYLCHSFFEDRHGSDTRPRDSIVWANRGGGKTQLGAVATLLDAIFKPGIQIRILGGSLEQSSKMHNYLRELLERDELADLIDGRITERRIPFANGSAVEILAQSEQSVRGHRVQKLRCDEVELFTPEVWQAAQYVTQSKWCGNTYVHGCIEALSTMHRPFGLMHQLITEVEEARHTPDATPRRHIFRWCVLDVLEHCAERDPHTGTPRPCAGCTIEPDCKGRARHRAGGFFRVEDAIQQCMRSSPPAWEAEMLCRKPSRSDCVFPEFDHDVHIVPFASVNHTHTSSTVTWVGGMDFGYRSPTVFLWACVRPDGMLHIVDEHCAREMTIHDHINHINRSHWPTCDWIGIDPAGYQRHEHLGTSTAALLKKAGFTLRARRLDLRAGIEAVQSRLRTADGSIRLAIDPRCKTLIESLCTYHYKPDDPDSDTPVKDGADHACDALRYLIINLDRTETRIQYGRYL
ncbi:MAG: hypothetical protein HND57_14150 [Planctomycetes bacterium]|nr:hypothetical protein [Planctomycetota bacterium]